MQQQVEALEGAGQPDDSLKEIQKILYSTEVVTPYSNCVFWLTFSQEGFEVPDNAAPVEEEETF